MTIGLAVPGATYLPLYVAVDAGTFAKQGIQAEVVEFRGGADVIRAVVSGSVDVGVVALAEITAGIDAGQPLKAFYAGFNIPDFDWYGVSSVKSLAGAKGKRIGITQYGSSTDFITRYALMVNGLDPSRDVQIIQAGPPATRLAAMQAGQLDVSIFSTPEKFLAAEPRLQAHLFTEATVRRLSATPLLRNGVFSGHPSEYGEGAASRSHARCASGQAR